MSKPLETLGFGEVERMRMTPIQRNYKRLQENNTPANVAKYLEYISSKSIEEILDDFNCLYTVPSITTYKMIDLIVKELYSVKDVSSLIYCKSELETFKMDCETKGINLFIEEVTNLIGLIDSYIKDLSNTKNVVDKVLESIGLHKGCRMETLLREYTSNLVEILTNEASDESDIINSLNKMCNSELNIELEKKANYTPKTTKVISNPSVLKKIGSSAVILGFNIYEFNKLISNHDTDMNVMLNSVKEAYDNILSASNFSFDDYNSLIESVESVAKRVYETTDIDSEIHLKMYESVDNLNKVYKKLMDSAEYKDVDIDTVEDEGSDDLQKVTQSVSPEIIEGTVDIEELPDDDIIDAINEYASYYETLEEYAEEDEHETASIIENMSSCLIKIETLLEDSGRNSVSAKIARKREQFTRKATNAVRKGMEKNKHATIATKKAVEHIDNLVSSTIEKIINAPYKDKREEIVKGNVHVKLHQIIKRAILHTGVFYINPVIGAIALLGAISRDTYVDARVRKQVVDELQEELKMVDEKIDDAKSDGNKQEKYQLMRMRSKIEKEIERVSQHRGKIDSESRNPNK